ncbi:inosine/uridine-preferring nucleoside hydrolase [Aspergillus steynii IBT 23096]|uniref:Inosine/uridine-preferring nucleoside hydrolase n=1 Tax=Aspergillus steynii IBT 23096 TaxID=1392250 RepID=A0A2I2G060_9EURO|nr:inosine/uridine-preferring nucleoside hydrolase [Aspergillus steynii IBT 23096]PLB46254.1 inosine/uridine-preferring nucleoside hydrolase [Aspergillus steynii IBT 23096]
MRWLREIIDEIFELGALRCLAFALAAFAGAWYLEKSSYHEGLIVDTNFFSDAGDAGALLLASTHPDANLLGVNVNYPSVTSALAVKNILGYYGELSVPVGLHPGAQNFTILHRIQVDDGDLAARLMWGWQRYSPRTSQNNDRVPITPSLDMYRSVLARAKRKGITIVSIGFLDDLSDLLNSPGDTYSSLLGYDLVKRKVKELVIMGGQYPFGQESNFLYNPGAAANVVRNWPSKIVFSGSELGRHALSGARLTTEARFGDPVMTAYWWKNGYNRSQESCDPLTMLYAIEGPGEMFEYAGTDGLNSVFLDGINVWVEAKGDYKQAYLKLKVSNETAAARLDDLFVQGAALYAKERPNLV